MRLRSPLLAASLAACLAGCATATSTGWPGDFTFHDSTFRNVEITGRGSLHSIRYVYEATSAGDAGLPKERIVLMVLDDVHDAQGLASLAIESRDHCHEPDCTIAWQSSRTIAGVMEFDTIIRSSQGNVGMERLVLRDGVAEMLLFGFKGGLTSASQADA